MTLTGYLAINGTPTLVAFIDAVGIAHVLPELPTQPDAQFPYAIRVQPAKDPYGPSRQEPR
jgi:hypothetical protein